MHLPSINKSKREILFIYGQHSSLERLWGLTLEMNKLGAVTVPDLPGLGGMTSLYKIGKPATIDNMAEYLASFIKFKYKNKTFTILGMSLGFAIVTRMLQKYPELVKRVDFVISAAGFSHHDDLTFSPTRMFLYTNASRVFSRRVPAFLFRHIALQPIVLRAIYHRTHNAKEKFSQASPEDFEQMMQAEIQLWHINDVRTQFKNYLEMFYLDNTKVRIDLPVYYVASQFDHYFDIVKVEEHMRRIFTDFTIFRSAATGHAPSIVATAEDAAPFVPEELKKLMNSPN